MTHTETIDTAIQNAIDAVIAHIAANPNQTESQACYLAKAEGVMDEVLAPLRALPAGQCPYIAMSSERRHAAVHRAFVVAVETDRLVRTGWRGGSAVYSVAEVTA